MMKHTKYLFVVLAFVVAGCAGQQTVNLTDPEIAYCYKVGGKVVESEQGGYCKITDDRYNNRW